MPHAAPANTRKVAYLDGVRGVAAFLVFVHHYCLAFYSAYYTFDEKATNLHGLDVKFGRSVFSVFTNGHFCVNVFFVLSGFVLSRKYFRTHDFEVIRSGAQRRFLRLYIPVAATMILAFIMMKASLFYNVQAGALTHSEWWLGGLWNIPDPLHRLWYCLKVGTMFQSDSAFDTSLWTMAIELTGSYFVFAFLAFTHKTRNAFTSLVLVFLYCKFTEQAILSAFVMGIGLNYVEKYDERVNKYVRLAVAVILLTAGLFLGSCPSTYAIQGTVFEHMPAAIARYQVWYHVVGAFFLVLAFVISPAFRHIASLRPFRFLGYISFSLYLLHPLLIGSVSSYLFLKMHDRFGYNHTVIYIFLLTTVTCLLLSWLMTKYVDDQGIRLSKYVYNRWIKKNPPQQLAEPPLTKSFD